MGMDVHGIEPDDTVDKYFANNAWWWHPLAWYLCTVAPHITKQCEDWHCHEGFGLEASLAKELALAVRHDLVSGGTAAYAAAYQAWKDALPDEQCDICGGTGKHQPVPDVGPGAEHCNGCDGKGTHTTWTRFYFFDVDNVTRFAAFLEPCGGSTIL